MKIIFRNFLSYGLVFLGLTFYSFHQANAKTSLLSDGYQKSLAIEDTENWNEFKQVITEGERQKKAEGVSYIISGVIGGIGATWGYDNAKDQASRGLFLVAQSAGIIALGYGIGLYQLSDEDQLLLKSIDQVSGISIEQKNLILSYYKNLKKQNEDSRRQIRWITHSVVALTYFYSAAKEENKNIRDLEYFLAGGNTLMAFTYMF